MSLRAALRRATGRLIHKGWAAVRAAGAITPASPGGYRFRLLGDGACIAFPVGAIFGEEWIEIGEHTLVGERVSLSAGMGPGLDLGPDPIVRIGGSCSIGRGSHIVGHQSIEIGDHVFTGPYVYITDQNHVYDDPEQPIGRQWPRNSPVSIGSGSWLGTGAIILPGTRIGRQSVVAGGAVVRGHFPDHSVLAGVPARVVRTYTPQEGWHRPGAGSRAPSASGTPTAPGMPAVPGTPTAPGTPAVPGTSSGSDAPPGPLGTSFPPEILESLIAAANAAGVAPLDVEAIPASGITPSSTSSPETDSALSTNGP